MEVWRLPHSLTVGGVDYKIRTDFRDILTILNAMGDPDLEADEKWLTCMIILYEDYTKIPPNLLVEAVEKAKEFIDMSMEESERKKPSLMDWEQDAQLIIPAVNKVVNQEIRALEYMHWWTFLSAYMEIGECSFSHILNIRTKKATGKKLEKWELEFIRDNKQLVELNRRLSEEEIDEEKRLEEKFG